MENYNGERRYQVVQPMEPHGIVYRFAAREKQFGAPVVIHRVDFAEHGFEPDAVTVPVARWGNLRDARLPLMIDAWTNEDSATWVLVEHAGVPLASSGATELLSGLEGGAARQAVFQSLSALAVLHEPSLSHRSLRADCFSVSPGGVVLLSNWGLDGRLTADADSKADSAAFTLSANYQSHDLASWAFAIGGVLLDRPLAVESELAVAAPVPDVVERARDALRKDLADKALAKLLGDCMEIRASDRPVYDNAVEALAAAFPGGAP